MFSRQYCVSFIITLTIGAGYSTSEKAPSSCQQFECTRSKRCISHNWVCDGESDCDDGSDEGPLLCAHRSCAASQFRCQNQTNCIPARWRCDKQADCADASDELDCGSVECEKTEFRCKNGSTTCIPLWWRCDHENDCKDGSDELDCRSHSCAHSHFSCGNGKCILRKWKCDGDDDCGDESDEKGCVSAHIVETKCGEGEFRCKNGLCIRKSFVCDGEADCSDGSDETISCKPKCDALLQHKCKNGKCISKQWLCDEEDDCGDGSDENSCLRRKKCPRGQWKCIGSTRCIPVHKICDSENDCGDNSDEGPRCSEVNCATSGCEHFCKATPTGAPICFCKEGYTLKKDGKMCEDIDECKDFTAKCDQKCINRPGSFKCDCARGYIFEPPTRCRFNSTMDAELIFADIKTIGRQELSSGRHDTFVTNHTRIVALDFDVRLGKVFFTDVAENKLYVTYFGTDTRGSKAEVIATTGLSVPDGLAVDWVTKNIYFAESAARLIYVCNSNDSFRSTLISTDIQMPRGLAIDPRDGFIFISDWGPNAHIERAWMDGSNRDVIVKDKIEWPNGLTLDYASRIVYWADARLDYIGAIDYYGRGRRRVVEGVKHPFALTLFEDTLYYTDWMHKGIMQVAKTASDQVGKVIIKDNLTRPMDLHVYHISRQPPAYNPCKADNGGCQHLCVIIPQKKSSCLCRYGYRLSSDKKSCESIRTFLLYARGAEIRGISLNPSEQHDVTIPILGMNNVVGIDFDANEGKVFFTDVKLGKIGVSPIDGSSLPRFIVDELQNPDGISVDWIGKNIYWSDAKTVGTPEIAVAKLTGEYRKTLITEGLRSPRAITVHPVKGYLFYTDWALPARIGRSSMDGSNHTVLINGSNLGWPNGLAIDFDMDFVYWADARTDTIERMTMDGLDRRIILSGVQHPFGLALNNERIFYSDWQEKCIFSISRKNISEKLILRRALVGLMEVQIYDPALQTGNNSCFKNQCMQLCLATPEGHTCACGNNFTLNKDNKTCSVKGTITPVVKCQNGSFQCANGRCIRGSWRCDGGRDCEDGSDETEEACKSVTCRPGSFACGTNRCIPPSWRCDSERDCDDGSDERNCSASTQNCTMSQFRCNNGRCIQRRWACDGENDCADWSDETSCGKKRTCSSSQFACDSRNCIPKAWRCDGEPDCLKGTDEVGCAERRCSEIGKFNCSSGKCIDLKYKCDGDDDCGDGSDERNCRVCLDGKCGSCRNETEFTCGNGRCIGKNYVCDFYDDCGDNSDEAGPCGAANCTSASSFKCKNGYCIRTEWECDGENDCGDGSDEANCNTTTPKQETCFPGKDWSCYNDSVCIELKKLCDGKSDCNDGSDEGPGCKFYQCRFMNGGCSHKCFVSPSGVECGCPSGMKLQDDRKSCQDVNECLVPNICSQKCVNVKRSYRCDCSEGYILRRNRRTCSAVGPDPFLIYSDRREIRKYLMKTQEASTIVSDLVNAIGLDFDWKEQTIYWSDVNEDRIEKAFLNGTGRKVVVSSGLIAPEGVAVDWIARNLYWTDTKTDTIDASRLDGSLRAVIVGSYLDSPRAIALDPRFGYLFWTDWGKDPRVERSDMDGANRKILARLNLRWPNGLALDYPNRLVYFMDARTDVLEHVTYEGKMRTKVMEKSVIIHPFALTMFEDFIYYSDWSQPAGIMRVSKRNSGGKFVIQRDLNKPMNLKVVHPVLQQHSKNSCSNNSCSHLCVLNPSGYTCKCPFGMEIQDDMKSCQDIDSMLIYARRIEIRGISIDPNDKSDQMLPVTQLVNAAGIDFEAANDMIYWSDVNKDAIYKMNKNGSGRSIIVKGVLSADDIAVDWLAENIYWTDTGMKVIEVSRLNGDYRKTLLSKGLDQPRGIAVFPQKGRLYWTDWGFSPKIEEAYLDGSNRTILIQKGLTSPNGLTIDYENEILFWCDARLDRIESFNLRNSSRKIIAEKSDVGHPFGITYFNGFVFWTDWLEQAIKRANVHSGEIQNIREGLSSLMGIEMFDKSRQQGNNSCAFRNGGCSHLCFFRGEDKVCGCASGFSLAANGYSCNDTKEFLLYTTTTEVRGIPFDITDEGKAIVPIQGLKSSHAADFYYKEKYIFVVDSGLEKLFRVKTDGSEFKTIIDSGLEDPEGLAVDWVAKNIYIVDAGRELIEVCRFDGSNRFAVVHKNLDKPRGMALYPMKGYMFWTDWGFRNPKIERALLDGSDRMELVNRTVLRDIGWPNGLAIDYTSSLVYWTDAKIRLIYRMDLDGGNIVKLKMNKELDHPYAITVLGDFIYWTDWQLQGLMRSSTNGTGHVEDMLSGVGSIRDVHAFSSDRQSGINSCSLENGGCEQLCLATSNVTHRCVCTNGNLDEDGKSCKPASSFALFAKRNEIITVHLDKFHDLTPPYKSLKAFSNVIGIDFDFKRKRVFFSDIFTNAVGMIYLNGTQKQIIASGLRTPDGIAYDWLTEKIYWTDAQENTISRVSVLKNTTREVIMTEDLDEPRAIVVSPCDGVLYWSDWGQKPYIKRATLDGLRPVMIADSGLGWPNGLCLDYSESRLYWADARTDRIESAELDGSDRKVIISGIPHVFGIAVFGQYIYWTDWVTRSVKRAGKYNGGNTVTLMERLDAQPMDIKIFSRERQNCSTNPCFDNGGCSHICRVKSAKHHCLCPPNLKLIDGFRCVKYNKTCPSGKFLCADGTCILSSLICDGEYDCVDASDENDFLCRARTCPAGRFACKTDGKCILDQWRCDQDPDCVDGSDEVNCKPPSCSPDDFRCVSNNRCISRRYICDGDKDCLDASDEKSCGPQTCPLETFNCLNASGCIPRLWLCDGEKDCADGSDESPKCKVRSCPAGQFSCKNGRCISATWYCDGEDDCDDSSDEPVGKCGLVNATCPASHFQCRNGNCISRRFLCDGNKDCKDGSDEDVALNKCANRTCNATQFKCHNANKCIPLRYKCDGDNDCGDASDESPSEGCPVRECRENEFRCKNDLCINSLWRCDGENDCGDKSDEKNCSAVPCPKTKLKCNNGICIDLDKKCNGIPDCPDSSDEKDCSGGKTPVQCEGQYDCLDNKTCIDEDKVCNHKQDCPNGTDEKGCFIDNCAKKKLNTCNQVCINLRQGYRCSCKKGYRLQPDRSSCLDIDECSSISLNNCTQKCVNTKGSFKCMCETGFQWDVAKKSCKLDGSYGHAKLIFSSKSRIRSLSLNTMFYDIWQQEGRHFFAVDFSYSSGDYFWLDTQPGQLFKGNISNPSVKKQLASTGLPSPLSLAVDWVGKNIYVTDIVLHSLLVFDINGRFFKTLIVDHVNQPRTLALCPQHGYVFYTVADRSASIARVQMDGKGLVTIIDKDIVSPKGIAVDFFTKRLYWADSHLHRIETASFDGHDRKVLIDRLNYPHAITIFGDDIFWSDLQLATINKAHKLSGFSKMVLKEDVDAVYSLKILHKLVQPRVNNPCEKDKAGCSTFCLLSANNSYSCSCPNNHHLALDQATCLSNCSSGEFECRNNRCIPRVWRCDTEDDCGDNSDEDEYCPERKCRRGQFQCANFNCTHPYWVCDGEDDCGDMSDEQNCEARQCFLFQFRCKNHRCTFRTSVCNGIPDCKDGSDEQNCTSLEVPCSSDRFKCHNNRCISSLWKCDGDDDCGDGSDEDPALCSSSTCPPDNFKCNNSRCIMKRYLCDDDDDCHDGSDESPEHCLSHSCSSMEFRCKNHRCISKRWKCDFDNDCGDNSDEKGCPKKKCNLSKEFSCANGRCIDKTWLCDQDDDCGDGSDEVSCQNKTCHPDQFSCASGHCINKQWKCDGEIDCEDGSDETNCPLNVTSCKDDQFKCANNVCIKRSWVCDGDNDCTDKSDEIPQICAARNWCDHNIQFRCSDGFCIRKWKRCDGVHHCADRSDEQGCIFCDSKHFKCQDSKCISSELVCNGIFDCNGGEDELECTKGKNESCLVNNGGCKHKCVQMKIGHICRCKTGHKIARNGRDCVDINECEELGSCSQKCQNTIGSFKCSCVDGYSQDLGLSKTCKAKGQRPSIIIPVEGELRRFSHIIGGVFSYSAFIPRLGKISSFDIHIARKMVYVGSRKNRAIKGFHFNVSDAKEGGSSRRRRDLNSSYMLDVNIANVDPASLAVDWVGNNLYWIDGSFGKPVIMISDLKGAARRKLITKVLHNPQAIVLDPFRGYIYWSDSVQNPAIWTAKMDGTNPKVFLTDRLEWPTGLALDFPAKRIFWADTKQRSINSINLDGSQRAMIFSRVTSSLVDFPFSIDVFEDYIYGVTWRSKVLFKMNKFGKGKVEIIANNLHLFDGRALRVLQDQKQIIPKGFKNPCYPNACKQICVAIGRQKRCICSSTGSRNSSDCQDFNNRTCDDSFCGSNGKCILFQGSISCRCYTGFSGERCQTKDGTKNPCHLFCNNNGDCIFDEKTGSSCRCHLGFSGSKCETGPSCSNVKCPDNSVCYIYQGTRAVCRSPPTTVKTELSSATPRSNFEKSQSGSSQINPLSYIIPVLLVVLLVIIVFSIMAWRKYRSRYVKSGERVQVNVNNPAFAYAGLEEDGDCDGFFEETKDANNFDNPLYDRFHGKRSSHSYSDDYQPSNDYRPVIDFNETSKLVNDSE